MGLSSAESEYCAITKAGCSGLGLQSLSADWNLKLQPSVHTDSSSAKAIASRRGTAKSTRHIQTRMLWVQERVAGKHLRVVKVATESNPADMLTKTLGRSKVDEFCAEIGQTEPRAEAVDKESKVAKKPKEVTCAVETMEMNETAKNKLKDARVSKIKNKLVDAKLAKIKNESKDARLRWMRIVCEQNTLTRRIFSCFTAHISMSHVAVVVLILFDSSSFTLHRLSHLPFHSPDLHLRLHPCGLVRGENHCALPRMRS